MLSRLMNLNLILLLLMSFSLVSCQDTVPARGLIESGTINDDDGNDDDDKVVVTRPDNAVKFKTDFCGCKDSVAITTGSNCGLFCAGKDTNGKGTLFVNFNVTEDISLNTNFQTINGWCNNPIEGEDANPNCIVKATDEFNNSTPLTVSPGSQANSLKVDIDGLTQDKVFVLTLLEESSGAKSDSVQLIKFTVDIPLTSMGPLKNAPISQYSCIARSFDPDAPPSEVLYDAAFRVHFYFLPRIPPNPIAAGSELLCHNWMNPLYGVIDNALYPRLEQKPGVFNLWDNTDPRFYDNNNNTFLDVNDIIIQKAKNFGSSTIPPGTRFFQTFPLITSSAQNTAAGGATSIAQSMGYYMSPWIDQTTFKSYCLNSTHYNSNNPLFKAMRDVVGVDMEGIYVGIKAPETVLDRDGKPIAAPSDFILIRETELKQVWFYMNNNVPTVPTDANVSSVAVYFYYPLNLASPFVRSSTQKLYQVKGATELNNASVNNSGNSSAGSATNYPPHDRKIGCIPKF